MKKIKHLISVILILAVAVLPTGCGGGTPDPAEFLNTVIETNEENMQFQGVTTAEMSLTSAGEEVKFKVSSDMAVDFSDMEDPKLAMEMSMDVTGMTIDMNMFYNEGYAYMDMMGMKIKQEAPMEALDGYYDTSVNIPDTEELFDITLTEEDGNYRIDYSISEEAKLDMINEIMTSMGNEYDLTAIGGEMEFTELSSSMLADKDGNMISSEILMVFTLTVESEVIDIAISTNTEYTAIGDDVVIEFPDFEEYIEAEIPAAA